MGVLLSQQNSTFLLKQGVCWNALSGKNGIKKQAWVSTHTRGCMPGIEHQGHLWIIEGIRGDLQNPNKFKGRAQTIRMTKEECKKTQFKI